MDVGSLGGADISLAVVFRQAPEQLRPLHTGIVELQRLTVHLLHVGDGCHVLPHTALVALPLILRPIDIDTGTLQVGRELYPVVIVRQDIVAAAIRAHAVHQHLEAVAGRCHDG